YEHVGVDLAGEGWNIDPASMSKVKDGFYGLGGVSFRGETGAHTRLKLKDRNHTRLELSYMRQPGGGVLQVSAEGRVLGSVETKGAKVEPGFSAFDIPPNSRHVEIRVMS